MTRSYVPLVAVLSAIWGGSYLLIKVGVRGFEPTTMMLIRVGVASAILVAFLAVRREVGLLRSAPRSAYALGIFNAVIPFTLIAWGEQYVDSGTAAVANAGVPLFVALLAPWLVQAERVTGLRLVGLVVGFGGVGWLVGLHPGGGGWFVAGTAAILVATVSYAGSTLYGQRLVVDTSGPVVATAAYLGATVILLPLGVLQAPHAWPDWKPLAAVLTLALFATALGQLLWFRLLMRYGSVRSALISYLLPAVALVYGSLFLGESLGVAKIGGLALILVGVVVAAGGGAAARPAAAPVDAR